MGTRKPWGGGLIRVPRVRRDGVVTHVWVRSDQGQAGQRAPAPAAPPTVSVAENPWGHPVTPLEMDLSPATHRIIDRLGRAGLSGLVVGGSVRDAVMGETGRPRDVDIEVYGGSLDEITNALSGEGRVDLVGKSFGVLKLSRDGEDFDISVPRRESKSGIGHRGFDVTVDPNMSLEDAARRRDFTMNALAYDPVLGGVVDPHGGLEDIAAGVIRHVDPQTFADDPLRVLRAVQFAGRMDFGTDPETVALCRSLSSEFAHLPSERVWAEMDKLYGQSIKPSRGMDLLHAVDWERHFPEIAAVRGVRQDRRYHPEGNVEVHHGLAADQAARRAIEDGLGPDERQAVVMAVALHDIGKATHTQYRSDGRITAHGHAESGADAVVPLLDRMGAPKKVQRITADLIREHMCVASTPDPTPKAARNLARRLAGRDESGPSIDLWARVVGADHAGRGNPDAANPADLWLTRLAEAPAPKKALLTGKDLVAEGMSPGPEFRPVLGAALAAQDGGEFTDRKTALAWLRSHLG